MCGRPPTADIEIQTFPSAAGADEEKSQDDTPNGKSTTDDETQCFFSQVLNNPLQLSYSVGRKDRFYAAIVATPKIEDFKVRSTFATQTESCGTAVEYPRRWSTEVDENAPLRYSYLRRKSMKKDSHVLSVSPIRHISICGADSAAPESMDSAESSPAIETPAKSSREDTRVSVSSMSASQPNSRKSVESEPEEGRKSDTTLKGLDQMDLDTVAAQSGKPDFLNSTERHDRMSLKRKFKPTFPRRLKLKLMICSYLHYHDTEGDVNFVHPSVKRKSVEPFLEATNAGEKKSSLGSVGSPEWMEDNGAVSVKEVLSCESFCCVCHSKMTSLEESLEGDQICCDECSKNADALLGEWEQSEVQSLSKEFGDLLSKEVLEKAGLVEESIDAETLVIREDKNTAIADESEIVCGDERYQCGTSCTDRTCPEIADITVSDNELPPKLTDESFRIEINDEVDLKAKNEGDSEREDKSVASILRKRGDSTDVEAEDEIVGCEHPESSVQHISNSLASKTEPDMSDADACSLSQSIHVDDPVFCEESTSEEAGYLFSETSFLGDSIDYPPQEDSVLSKEKGKFTVVEEPAVFSLSSVQIAIRSALEKITPSSPVPLRPLSSVPPVVRPSPPPSILITPEPPDEIGSPENVESESDFIPAPELKSIGVDSYPTKSNASDESLKVDSSKPSQVCPLAVPPGSFISNPESPLYTEFPAQTYDFPDSKLGCLSKPRNSLVFYEVSRVKSKNDVQTKNASVENEAKVTVRPGSNASVIEGVYLPSVPQEERRRSVGALANFSRRNSDDLRPEQNRSMVPRSAPPCESKCGFPGFSIRPQDLRRGFPGRGFSREIGPVESGKYRHRSEILNEDDARNQQDYLNDKSCMCLKRGRKCNCNLTKLLHVCPLPPPRPQRQNVSPLVWSTRERAFMPCETTKMVRQKCRNSSSKKSVTFSKPEETWSGVTEFVPKESPSFSRAGSIGNLGAFPRLGRRDSYCRLKEAMPSLIEESLSGNSFGEGIASPPFVEADATQVSQAPIGFVVAPGCASSAVPGPPPPSPITSLPSPPSSLRRDRLPRRRPCNVSFREAQDIEEIPQFLPQLAAKQRSQLQDDNLDKKS